MDEAQLAALIDQRVAERTRELEEQLARVTKNRDSLLREKRELEGRTEAGRGTESPNRVLGESEAEIDQPADRVIIRRGVAPAEYQRLKAAAIERGVPYEVQYAPPEPPAPDVPRVKFVETDAYLYGHKAMMARIGVAGMSAEADQRGKKLILYRRPDDLPPRRARRA
jgi:hypothetical protein